MSRRRPATPSNTQPINPSGRQQPALSGLLERLVAAVRPEFRVEVLVPEVGDPIFGPPPCVVAGCDRAGLHKTTGLCRGHHRRWQLQGRPELAAYITATPPRTCGRAQLAPCAVPGCGYARARQGCATVTPAAGGGPASPSWAAGWRPWPWMSGRPAYGRGVGCRGVSCGPRPSGSRCAART